MVRIIVTRSDFAGPANIGSGHADIRSRSFDIENEALEKALAPETYINTFISFEILGKD